MPTTDLLLEWKRGDDGPSQVLTLTDNTGAPANLTNAQSVTWRARNAGTGDELTDVLAGAELVDEAAGQIRKDLDPAVDTAAVGVWRVNVSVVFSDGHRQTFPEDRYVWAVVRDDLTAPA